MNQPLLQILRPEQVEVEVCRSEELDRRRGLTSEPDEMWSYVRSKAYPRWLWHAIDYHTGKVLGYVFGQRKDEVFLATDTLEGRIRRPARRCRRPGRSSSARTAGRD